MESAIEDTFCYQNLRSKHINLRFTQPLYNRLQAPLLEAFHVYNANRLPLSKAHTDYSLRLAERNALSCDKIAPQKTVHAASRAPLSRQKQRSPWVGGACQKNRQKIQSTTVAISKTIESELIAIISEELANVAHLANPTVVPIEAHFYSELFPQAPIYGPARGIFGNPKPIPHKGFKRSKAML